MKTYKQLAMLLERKSARLFHVTQSKYSFESILDGMSLRSSGSEYSRLSMKAKNKGKHSYISFARSMNSAYVNGVIKNDHISYVFEFDWDKMRSNNLFGKINYFGDSGTEEEERLYTNKDYLPIDRYLTAVHICVNSDVTNKVMDRNNQAILDFKHSIEKITSRIEEYEIAIAQIMKAEDSPGHERIRQLRNYIEIFKDDIENKKRTIREYENFASTAGDAEFEVRDTIKGFAKNLGDVPVWLYSSPAAMRAVRWAEADQINPNAGDYSDGDTNENL